MDKTWSMYTLTPAVNMGRAGRLASYPTEDKAREALASLAADFAGLGWTVTPLAEGEHPIDVTTLTSPDGSKIRAVWIEEERL